MRVLNQLLYDRLRSSFGHVKVSNPGKAFIATDTESIFSEPGQPPRMRLEISNDGEYYMVFCPYCLDTRYRLYVNHMYGKKSDAGRQMKFLAVCYNEACMRKEENREDFQRRLAVTDLLTDGDVGDDGIAICIAREIKETVFVILDDVEHERLFAVLVIVDLLAHVDLGCGIREAGCAISR